jgi:hypothetical protein
VTNEGSGEVIDGTLREKILAGPEPKTVLTNR